MKNKLIAFIVSMGIFGAKAQGSTTNDTMASLMRSNGKIYVVVAVVLTILLGLIVFDSLGQKNLQTRKRIINTILFFLSSNQRKKMP